MTTGITETQLTSLKKVYTGKVRDLYAIDKQRLLMVATDRLSAFDVILNDPIPGKGQILTAISSFWFTFFSDLVPNHLTHEAPESFVRPEEIPQIAGRSVVAKKLKPLPIEAVVRGYLAGSGWKEYRTTGTVCGINLPSDLREAEALPQPIFTPATKAAVGEHDENISFKQCIDIIGETLANQVKAISIKLYSEAAAYALQRGVIIADTKFEFGLDEHDTLTLMDEVLTPDSSRFWPIEGYQEGINPPSFDKQFVRNWLEASGWNKKAPAPSLPTDVCQKTAEKYQEALTRLTQSA